MSIHQPVAEVSPAVTASTGADRAIGVRLNVEAVAWALVLAVAAGWRLVHLGRGLPATPEALSARAAWDFANGGEFVTWPGDLASAVAALCLRLGGDGLGWARLGSALFGVLSVAALALVRPYLGRGVALVGALLLACSPVAVASSRTLSPDAAGLLCGLIALALVLRVTESGDVRALPPLAAGAGVALGSGAVAPALGLVAVVYVVIEIAWLDRRDIVEHWRGVLAARRQVTAAALLFVAGLVMPLLRFGAGPDRHAVAAVDAGSPPASDAASAFPWHAPVGILLGYEPAVLLLGTLGVAVILVRWGRLGTAAVTPGERLLVEWAAVGLTLTLALMHHRPGQLLMLGLPLMLLAAAFTLRAIPTLAAMNWRESGPALALAAVILGYILLEFLEWAALGEIPRDRSFAEVVGLLAIAAGLIAWALLVSPNATPGAAIVGMWLLMGWIAVHGAAVVALRDGDEFLTGRRPAPVRATLVRNVEAALAEGKSVAVERPLAAALAWELRGRDVRVFNGPPPQSDLAVTSVGSTVAPGFAPAGAAADVERRWYPSTWDAEGIVRWLAYRIAWTPSQELRGEAMISVGAGPGTDGARP
jgi:hypothetical protein